MRVPVSLVNAFQNDFEPILADFLIKSQLIDLNDPLENKRYLTRSIAPHVKGFSELFNRKEGTQTDGIDHEDYWSEGNAKNKRLAYLLSFMPPNLFRVASVWAELHRLGFQFHKIEGEFRGLEFGAGVASGACGILAGEKFAPIGLPENGSFALIEQSKAALQMGANWFDHLADRYGMTYKSRSFHRRVELNQPWLPKTAPQFHLMVMSFFLNESPLTPEAIALELLKTAENHLEQEGLMVIVEPALKLQSRKLLLLRKALIEKIKGGNSSLKILLPCLGEQACGALIKEEDWCHEEVDWMRPKYLRELDLLTGLDRRTLPFSYLVIQKTNRSLNELFGNFEGLNEERYRLVSPSKSLSKRTSEFFMCGQDGKRRTRFTNEDKNHPERGDLLQNVKLHGEHSLTQIDSATFKKYE
jgi:ribosomal protein RSM22 (predicted rRNA methylase)